MRGGCVGISWDFVYPPAYLDSVSGDKQLQARDGQRAMGSYERDDD